MQKFQYGKQSEGVVELVSFLSEKRKNKNFRVIDVGGAIGPYFWNHTDTILDWNEPADSNIWVPEEYGKAPSIYKGEFIQCDITNEVSWKKVLDKVSTEGKYDFAICRHTLEDIENPRLVTDMLQQIAKAGFIAFPSKHMEMEKGYYRELPKSRGAHHHRWIFITKNGKLYGLPKMGWTDSIKDKDLKKMKLDKKLFPNPKDHELRFYWEDSINVIYLHAAVHDIPSNYGDEFIIKSLENVKTPWEVWLKLLINSD